MQRERLGPYQIECELGAGGMGKVYAATVAERVPGLDDGARVALKVVHPHLLETSGFFRRFMREAELGASIRHENVVRTFMADALAPHHFLVMEYVEGQTLHDLQEELDKVPEELCRHVGREIAKGLGAIHAAGVVHRDLKPENVLITADHVVKVMDLGVARLADESIRLSQSGAFVGSVEYAAPEQFGGEVDHRCDLHALGLLLYELSSGQHPFRGDDFRAVMKRVCEEQPRRLGEVNPQLSPFFEEVVHALLAKRAGDRFASADDVLRVLAAGEDSAWWKNRATALRAETNRPLRRIRIPRETAVYGREKELATLRARFDAAKAGEGQVVLIEGEAGIGKSRLVDELIGRLRADGENLNFLFGSYPPGGAATVAEGFSCAYREHFGDAGSANFLLQTPLLAPAFDAVLRGEPAPPGTLQLTQASLGTCFVHATRNLAAECTTVVLIDDLHFAPDDARSLFSSIALAVPGHRLLLVGTARPGVPEDWLANLSRLDHSTRMELARLGPKDLGALLEDTFGSSRLAQELAFQVGTKSDGNPFFVFEIVRGLREGQFITQKEDGTWVSTRVIDEIRIPASVLDLVNARVAGLDDVERNLLDVAACWGYAFDAALVGEALGLRRLPVLQAMAKIEKRDRLVRSSGRHFVFDHHQVQEALYGALPEMLREEYHAALAEALEARTGAAEQDPDTLDGAVCVDLCEHFLRGARGASALRYLRAAQSHLEKGYLHAQVVDLTERALAIPGLLTGVERALLLIRLTKALEPLGRSARHEECAREAERLAAEAGDDGTRADAFLALGVALWRTSRPGEAEAAFRRAEETALARDDQPTAARAIGSLGNVYYSQGRLDEAGEHFARHLESSRESGCLEDEARASGNLGLVLQNQGRLAEARKCHERSLAIDRASGHRLGESIALGNLGVVLQMQGRRAEAGEYYARHLALSRETGNRYGEAIATGNLGNVFFWQGDPVRAGEHYERSCAVGRELGFRSVVANSLGNLGLVAETLGLRAEARAHYEQQYALCDEIGDQKGAVYALINLGVATREEGDSEESERLLSSCRELSVAKGYASIEMAVHGALGSLLAATGAPEKARASLTRARDLAVEIGDPSDETLARCELARLPGGDAQDAIAAFVQHGERLGAAGRREARLLLWRATGDQTHLAEAKRLLDEALAKVPEEYHESMCQNLRVNREILAAWAAAGGETERPA